VASGTFWRKITYNWLAKVFAIVMAIILYLFQLMNGISSSRFDIPLSLKSNPDLVPVTSIPVKVRVTVSGDSSSLNTVNEADFTASIDLSKFNKAGIYRAPVEIRSVETRRDIDILNVSVSPTEVEVSLDKRDGKYFTVNPDMRGSVAPGFELVHYVLSPRQVYLEGPAGVIAGLKNVITEPIDITGRDSSFTRNVRILDSVPSVNAHEHTVQFNAVIKSIDLVKEFDNIPLAVVNLADGWEVISPLETGSIRLQGNEIAVGDWTPEAGTLSVDCAQIIGAGEYQIPVSVHLPDAFIAQHYEPETVTLSIRKKNGKSKR
jgi:YbbR domain-containing protein